MKYRCKKCGELYDELPEECDYDCEQEFDETDICHNCGEYEVLYGNYCLRCIREHFNDELGKLYIEYLDEQRKKWGLEEFFKKEYEYFSRGKGPDFLWEYCSSNLEGLGEYIFDINIKRGGKVCSDI